MTVEDQKLAHDGMGEAVGRFLVVLFADNGMAGSRDVEWLHHLMNVLVGLFRRYGLAANVAKYRTMTCQPGTLRLGMSAEAKDLKCAGVEDSYHVRLWKRTPLPECGVELTVGSMTAHC